MSVVQIKSSLEGDVLPISMRTLSEREMAGVVGAGPMIVVEEDPPIGMTPSWCSYNGVSAADDCQD